MTTTATPQRDTRLDNDFDEEATPVPSKTSPLTDEKPITPAPDGGKFESLMERALEEEAKDSGRTSSSPTQRSGGSPSKKPFLRRGQVCV